MYMLVKQLRWLLQRSCQTIHISHLLHRKPFQPHSLIPHNCSLRMRNHREFHWFLLHRLPTFKSFNYTLNLLCHKTRLIVQLRFRKCRSLLQKVKWEAIQAEIFLNTFVLAVPHEWCQNGLRLVVLAIVTRQKEENMLPFRVILYCTRACHIT